MEHLSNKPEVIIDHEEALTHVRQRDFTGPAMLEALSTNGNAYILDPPPGFGKTYAVDCLMETAIDTNAFEAIIFTAPTKKILRNSRILTDPNRAAAFVMLEGRPRKLCGTDRDQEWSKYEQSGTTSLGKQEICAQCELLGGCHWPEQMTRLKPGIRLVYLPQSYLETNPEILGTILQRLEQRAPLLIMDEINFTQIPFLQCITRNHLQQYHATLQSLLQVGPLNKKQQQKVRDTAEEVQRLMTASLTELCTSRWFFYPLGYLSLHVQAEGLRLFGTDYRHLEYTLCSLGRQPGSTRHRTVDGSIRFTCLPSLDHGGKLLICSATASPEVLEHRLGISCARISGHLKILHRDTRFLNLALGTGLKKYHTSRIGEMTHFAASYAIQELRKGRLTAFVTKKVFTADTVTALNQWFASFRVDNIIQVVPLDQWQPCDDKEATEAQGKILLPLLHYGGAIGFNDLEHIENIICVCGYYMRNQEICRLVNEVLPPQEHITCAVEVTGRNRRRVATTRPDDPYTRRLVHGVMEQEELGVVIQAVSRIRPFTKPRTVITCQLGESPRMPYDREFSTLKQARDFFHIDTPKQQQSRWQDFQIHLLLRQGMTQPAIAQRLRIGERTVSRRRAHFTNNQQANG